MLLFWIFDLVFNRKSGAGHGWFYMVCIWVIGIGSYGEFCFGDGCVFHLGLLVPPPRRGLFLAWVGPFFFFCFAWAFTGLAYRHYFKGPLYPKDGLSEDACALPVFF